MPCWEGQHLGFVAATVIAMLLFYPAASFMYPNLQFSDPRTDIKFRPEYVIIHQQARLCLAGFAMLFREEPQQLVYSALLIYILLLVANLCLRPCLVPWVNSLRSALFVVCIWGALCSTALLHGVARHICIVALLVGGCICLGIGI